jgi:hypothetical protein
MVSGGNPVLWTYPAAATFVEVPIKVHVPPSMEA